MYKFIFTKDWQKDLNKLSVNNKNRVIKKLQELKKSDNIFFYLKKLINFEPYTHRLRIWSIRVLLMQKDSNTFYVLNIWSRWDIYK